MTRHADPRLLMCAPTEYDIRYEINPWMRGQVDSCDRASALRQWSGLYRALARNASIVLVEPEPDWPDMVFTANAGFVVGNRVALARFRHAERRGEEAFFRRWFERNGFETVELAPGLSFEGAGDALLDRALPLAWMGHGHRSDPAAAAALEHAFDLEVLPLRLVDPRFYHLDTCLCPLAGGELMYHPAAFDEDSNRLIESRVPPELRIAVGDRDAAAFACNAVSVADCVVLNYASQALEARLAGCGYRVEQAPLDEFIKAGGAAKCLTLRLDEQRLAGIRAAA